ncbi:MAG: glycoside hydrolase family 57 [Gammaproteobacteria bacterium]|jgi:alpha-amylase/alpha-mannosidase (GH57 family)|nr:glycoside hydrolase family 57 [Gammaproteobacteria bacterium]
MTTAPVRHALGLHMHQPPGNLTLLAEANPFEAEQIIRCYERAARYAHRYPEEGRLHVGFSGVLLEQLRDPAVVDHYRRWVDIPAMLDSYRSAENVEIIGMGYYHPIFPLIPTEDWAEQLAAGRQIVADTFGRAPAGFWPPEMAFTMEMVPALVQAGYRYVVVDGVHVRPEDGVQDIYRPYLACHEGHCITVVPRDRDVSNAQESGLSPAWFANEVRHKVAGSPRPQEPRLVTTWSDGENGGWFRQLHEPSGFFGHFFAPYMEHVRYGDFPTVPVLLSDDLTRHPATTRAQVRTGAWNVGSTSGYDFSQWAGSPVQRQAVEALVGVSRRYHELAARADGLTPKARRLLRQARALVLEAETSCFLFWGDDWIPQLFERTRPAEALLAEVSAAGADAPPDPPPPRRGPIVRPRPPARPSSTRARRR